MTLSFKKHDFDVARSPHFGHGSTENTHSLHTMSADDIAGEHTLGREKRQKRVPAKYLSVGEPGAAAGFSMSQTQTTDGRLSREPDSLSGEVASQAKLPPATPPSGGAGGVELTTAQRDELIDDALSSDEEERTEDPDVADGGGGATTSELGCAGTAAKGKGLHRQISAARARERRRRAAAAAAEARKQAAGEDDSSVSSFGAGIDEEEDESLSTLEAGGSVLPADRGVPGSETRRRSASPTTQSVHVAAATKAKDKPYAQWAITLLQRACAFRGIKNMSTERSKEKLAAALTAKDGACKRSSPFADDLTAIAEGEFRLRSCMPLLISSDAWVYALLVFVCYIFFNNMLVMYVLQCTAG